MVKGVFSWTQKCSQDIPVDAADLCKEAAVLVDALQYA